MKRILLILVLLCTTIAFSQEKTFESEVRKISEKISKITEAEKLGLKKRVEKINKRLKRKEITIEEADRLKKEAAEFHAKNIEYKVGVEEEKLQSLVQDKVNGKIASDYSYYDEESFEIGNKIVHIRINETKGYNERMEKRKKRAENRRTTSQLIFALGINNVLIDNKLSALDNSDYKFIESHFYELGWAFKTRFSKKPSITYFKYGLSFLWNNLRAESNKYHLINGKTTCLHRHSESLSESRLRNVQLIFPVHIELDFSKNKVYDNGKVRDVRNKSIRLGFGGYAGFRLNTKQFLEYQKSTGTKIEELQKDNFNINDFTYGLSTYLAWRSYGIYAKYDLSPLFKGTEIRNISFGIRFDIN